MRRGRLTAVAAAALWFYFAGSGEKNWITGARTAQAS